MSRNVTIGLVQMDCVMLDKEANLRKAKEFIEQAAQQHTDIICFPEMFSTGYSPSIIGPKYIEVAEDPDGATFAFLAELAKKHHMYIVAPIVLKSKIPGLLYNGLIVISRDGQLMGTYNKTHLWAGERFWFRAGDRYPVFDMDFGKVGLMICYDGGFPEVSRILALSGAELILCPSAFPIRDKDMWDVYFASRSLENCCFVAGINRVGTEDDCHMFGNNKIYNFRGHLLAEAPVDQEFLLVHTVDLDDVAYHRCAVSPGPPCGDLSEDHRDVLIANREWSPGFKNPPAWPGDSCFHAEYGGFQDRKIDIASGGTIFSRFLSLQIPPVGNIIPTVHE